MADVRPFPGVRFDPARVELGRVLCPPYDVIDPEHAIRLRGYDFNAVHLELPEGMGVDKYRNSAATWSSWRRSGMLVKDKAPCFYVCEERFNFDGKTRRRVGFLGALGVTPKAAKSILPHERTLPKPKADRLELLKAVKANISPIFGIFPDPKGAVQRALKKALAKKPTAEGSMPSGVAYRLWAVSDKAVVKAISSGLAAQKILIADGHHRYEVSKAYYELEPSNETSTVLAYLCPEEDPGLVVLPTHRIVEGLPVAETAKKLCELKECEGQQELLKKLAKARSPYAFGLVEKGYTLAEPRADEGCRSGLSVEWIGRSLFGGHPPDRIRYTPDPARAEELAGNSGTVVLVKPFAVSQIREAVERVGLLPPKSTYFYPKIATGLVFKSLEK